MKKHFFSIAILVVSVYTLVAQKEDNTWLLGGSISSFDSSFYRSCLVDFNNNPSIITITPKQLPFDFTNSSICDSFGQIRCYSNGENLYNKEHEILENGSNFYPNSNYINGFPGNQGFILLPVPEKYNKLILLYGEVKVVNSQLGYTKFQYAISDMALNGGFGKVVQRDILLSTDTLTVGQLTATRHGNGRDWWIIVPGFEGGIYFKFLLSPKGILKSGYQEIETASVGLGQAVFSPDGQWYARFNWHGVIPDSSFSTFDLYHFDRCSGLLSDRITKTYSFSGVDGKPGGLAFSNSSRFLYVSRWDTIYQYDLQSADILASEIAVAGYDGFTADFDLPTRFFTLQLAPDNKIYCAVSNHNSRYLHVIENPDLPGLACNVQQHAVHLPVFNNNVLPNLPYYRLWEWADSPCDTLGSVAIQELDRKKMEIRLYPNPTTEWLTVESATLPTQPRHLRFYDAQGRLALECAHPDSTRSYSFDISILLPGLYFVEIVCSGGQRYIEKIIVGR